MRPPQSSSRGEARSRPSHRPHARTVGVPFLAALVVLAATAPPAGAVVAPPAAAPAAVAATLGEGVSVEVEADRFTVWPVESVAAGDGTAGLGVAFPALPAGALLGVLELSSPWTDYRGQRIEPGVYTLRYLVEPEDGYHLGVSLYRDFALLLPAARDADPAPLDAEMAVAAAAGTAGTHHPAVLALWPVGEMAPGELFENDLGQPTLVIDLAGTPVGLVLAGVGETGG
jgi:hypothetical protein